MMFPNPMPEMPPEIMDAAMTNPDAFAEAMGSGMEAFQDAMGDSGDMGAAFEAMGDVMGPMFADMGVSPEVFDAAGDAVGAGVGGAMHMAPADAGGPEMGAMIQDCVEMMAPPGTEMPAPIMDAMGDMGQGFADAGCSCHDMAGEMMPPPGDAGFPLPCDASGDCIVPPGDPAACPADACQPPPVDGACATMDAMMPPEGGYDHAPMPADAQMPPPFEMAVPDPTGELAGSEFTAPAGDYDPNLAPDSQVGPMDPGAAPGLDAAQVGPMDPGAAPGLDAAPVAGEFQDPGAMGALDGALGADPAAAPPPVDDPMAAADEGIGAALDAAQAQSDAGVAPASDHPDLAMDDPAMDPGMVPADEPDDSGSAIG